MEHLEQLIPLAAGIMISPLPIAAIIAILLSPRAKANGLSYTAAFLLVCFAITAVAASTTKGAGSNGSSGDHVIVLVLGIVLSVGFAVLAVVSWMTRPKSGATATAPGWLTAVDSLGVGRAFGLGVVMAVTNAKNIPLELKAGALIGASDLGLAAGLGLSALFAVAASLGLLLPTVLASTGSPAITRALTGAKAELIAHNAIIMTVLFAILAAVQISHVVATLAG